MKDHFKHKAEDWDTADVRVQGAKKIADAIEKNIQLDKDMEILDFGVGTGLLGFEIAKKVQQVYGVDTSANMLEKLQEKNTDTLQIKTFHQNILQKPIEQKFDGVISSMTLHHVQDLEQFFETIYANIKKNGFLAIADLESEDGSFHSDNKGVHHFGFDTQELHTIVAKAGFKDISFKHVNTIRKPHKDFKVFLLLAYK